MSGSSAQASEPVPDCPKCARAMVRRTARARHCRPAARSPRHACFARLTRQTDGVQRDWRMTALRPASTDSSGICRPVATQGASRELQPHSRCVWLTRELLLP